ncbi:YbaB/EbfC family nucleoid-associated protein [Nocardia tengchongensis]|uniref:YbaB/EbfC family nucleoid-associated protein n=1 Tax=Nocardia tengchongensis TaxID=2055889 RepID=UPI0036AE90CF
MTNEAAKGQLTELMELVQGGIASVARAQQERARLTATAHAAGRRVTITVNADCIVIKTEFSDDIDDLEYSEIAAAVTTATQEAAAKVQEMAQKIMEQSQEEQSRIPALSEFFPEMPDIKAMMPPAPTVSTAAPGSPERTTPEPEPAVRFTNVEEWDHDGSSRSSISAPEW